MTDQERTVEERKELLDDLLNAAVSVEEPQASQQAPAPAEVETTPAESAEAEGTTPADTADAAPAAEAAPPAAETAPADSAEASVPAGEAPAAEATSDAAPAAEAPAATYEAPPAESGRPRRVKDLEAGMELEGRVTSIALYGIFVDIGVGRDGLVHISEMSDTRIDSPSDLVKIGDKVNVRVKSVEPDGRRISLTMRSKERQESRGGGGGQRRGKRPEPNKEALSTLRVGDNVEGTITGLAPFGVFVDIGVGKDGLVHVSELAEGRIEKAEDVVKVGETYTFKVLEVDADGARISLSLRRALRSQRMQQLTKGQIVEGTISGIAPFGAFVDIGVGRDGLVHISELSEGRVGKVEDAVKAGDKVMVRVLDVDMQSKRISLTMRLEDPPADAQPTPTPAAANPDRFQRPPREDRFQRPPREERDRGRGRSERQPERQPETYSSADPDEPFTGDATLEDLVSKFGRRNPNDRRRRSDEEEDPEERFSRKQRDAQRRTLGQTDDE